MDGEESFEYFVGMCRDVLDGCRCVDADDADKRGVWLNSLIPCQVFPEIVIQICVDSCLEIEDNGHQSQDESDGASPCDKIREDCFCDDANDDQVS